MEIIAHRGAKTELPENTLDAFKRAAEIGVDAIETDLLLTKDGRMVCRHDDLILMNGKWAAVQALTLGELQRVDLGGGRKVPVLEEFLDQFQTKLPLLLDLKCRGLAGALRKLLGARGTRNLHFTSFIHSEIRELAEIFPEAGRSLIFTALPPRFEPILEDARVREVSLFRGYLDRETVEALHRRQVRVRIYPVNALWEAETFRDWKVEGIFTDDPAAMKSLR